jgi:hypothetical protein
MGVGEIGLFFVLCVVCGLCIAAIKPAAGDDHGHGSHGGHGH